MFLMQSNIHQVIKPHRVLDALRREARRGKDVIVFRHALSRQYILAETNGRNLREVAVLKGWPNLSERVMRGLVKQLRPMPNVSRAKNKVIQKVVRAKLERNRNCGRFNRELMARVQRATKGVRKDHPSINWGKIKGEGV